MYMYVNQEHLRTHTVVMKLHIYVHIHVHVCSHVNKKTSFKVKVAIQQCFGENILHFSSAGIS